MNDKQAKGRRKKLPPPAPQTVLIAFRAPLEVVALLERTPAAMKLKSYLINQCIKEAYPTVYRKLLEQMGGDCETAA